MRYEHDVFISYPHLSNRTDSSGQNGWVARFHLDLEIRLENYLGRKARIWRDNKMSFGTQLRTGIPRAIRKSKVFICILSPAYLNSSWCRRELEAFREFAGQNGGLTIGDQSRVMVVAKTPAEINRLGLDEPLIASFYEESEDRGGAPRAFSQIPKSYKYDDYDRTLDQLAWAINGIVSQFEEDEAVDIARTIYLAETSSDRTKDRKKIETELAAREFIVLPQKPYAANTVKEYAQSVQNDLDRSFMSIHLFGERFERVLKGDESRPDETSVSLQNRLAAEHSAEEPSFKRVIWIPPKLPNKEPDQNQFLKDLRIDEQALRGAEMIERSFEDFRTRLLQIFSKDAPKDESGLYNIYLMCDRQDNDFIEPVSRFLVEKGYEVSLPPEEPGNGKYHRDSLRRCDAALTIYGKVNFEWVQHRYREVVDKAKGWRRDKEISFSAILPTDPETERKRVLYVLRRSRILSPCYNVTTESLLVALNEFIDALETGLRI